MIKLIYDLKIGFKDYYLTEKDVGLDLADIIPANHQKLTKAFFDSSFADEALKDMPCTEEELYNKYKDNVNELVKFLEDIDYLSCIAEGDLEEAAHTTFSNIAFPKEGQGKYPGYWEPSNFRLEYNPNKKSSFQYNNGLSGNKVCKLLNINRQQLHYYIKSGQIKKEFNEDGTKFTYNSEDVYNVLDKLNKKRIVANPPYEHNVAEIIRKRMEDGTIDAVHIANTVENKLSLRLNKRAKYTENTIFDLCWDILDNEIDFDSGNEVRSEFKLRVLKYILKNLMPITLNPLFRWPEFISLPRTQVFERIKTDLAMSIAVAELEEKKKRIEETRKRLELDLPDDRTAGIRKFRDAVNLFQMLCEKTGLTESEVIPAEKLLELGEYVKSCYPPVISEKAKQQLLQDKLAIIKNK